METLDCRGQRCPLPVIALARKVAKVAPGSVVRVLADDPAAAGDIPAWCRLRGHEFLAATPLPPTTPLPAATAYDVRKLPSI